MTHSDLLDRWAKFLKIIGVTLLPYQQELAFELLKLPFTAKLKQSRQSGKSFDIGLLCYFLMYVMRWDIVVTAPTQWQTRHIMKYVHRSQDKIRARENFSNRYSLSLKGRGSIHCLSGSETANVEGPSAHLVVVEEHQDIRVSHASEVFVPMLSWTSGLFWSVGIGGDPGSVAEREGADFEWNLPYQEVVKVKPEYQRIVDIARRDMLPEEFAAHYECKPLDMSAKRLVSHLEGYRDADYKTAYTTVGIDWGKRLDQSVATVIDRVEEKYYITGWLVPTGSYDTQITKLAKWLKEDIEYDEIISETNGVGDGCTDVLIKEMGTNGSSVAGIHVHSGWLTDMAKLVHRIAASGDLKYNEDHELSGVFVKDIKEVDYKMLDTSHVKCTHSDFLSSMFCALHTPGVAYL